MVRYKKNKYKIRKAKKLKKQLIISTSLIVFFIIFGVCWTHIRSENLKANPKYTVGTIYRKYKDKRGLYVRYEFIVGKVKYNGGKDIRDKDSINIGDKFEVIYEEGNPSNSKIILNKRIADE
ncbi:MAG: hypothetical protein HRT66_02795 [Flavobacteriaceae bacterium]|nr:hypothetical protein [Flavobacteriaceae bacterium]